MTELKQTSWTKIHNEGETFESKANVMDIAIHENTCVADATFTANTKTFEKAAYWMLRYLGHAEATKILEIASAEIENKTKIADKDTEMIDAKGEGWTCEIKKIGKGVFQTTITWTTDEPTTRKLTKKEIAKEKAEKEKIEKAQNTEKAEK